LPKGLIILPRQVAVHGDAPSKITQRGFRSFLIDTPLEVRPRAFLRRATVY
jgi:hypothetical protein